MVSSCLHPPSSYEFTDLVIGDVRQRAAPLRSFIVNTECGRTEHVSNLSKAVGTSASVGFLGSRGAEVLSRKGKTRLIKSFVDHGSPPSHEFAPGMGKVHKKRRHTKEPEYQTQPETPVGFTPRVSKTRRERCRINQARYREKQRQYAQDLEKDIQHFKEGIYYLELQRQSIIHCFPTNQTVWNVAAEYFRLFRHGYMAPVLSTTPSQGINGAKTISRSHLQLNFLQSAMAVDVVDGAMCGAEELLEHWKLLSLYHKDVHMQLKRLENGPDGSLVATTTTSLIITENTLRNVYPHLVTTDNKEVGWSRLAKTLLNHRVVMHGSVRFIWDSNNSRVAHLETKADLFTPMLHLLGNIEDVARVFDSALITPECKMVVRSYYGVIVVRSFEPEAEVLLE